MDHKTPFYYASIGPGSLHRDFWNSVYPKANSDLRFWIDTYKVFDLNGLIARSGEWFSPWNMKVPPQCAMPHVVEKFSKTFEEITDARAIEIRDRIRGSDAKIAVFYSGGIDSTVCLAALVRNLTAEELANVHVCLSAESIVENPTFFDRFIRGRMTIHDSAKTSYGVLADQGYLEITSDQGDSLFGTEAGLQLYYMSDVLLQKVPAARRTSLRNLLSSSNIEEIHYSQFKDLVAAYFAVENNPEFGYQLFERIHANIESARAPVHSLHDYFWWVIFNLKYTYCAFRPVLHYFGGKDRRHTFEYSLINWFNQSEYQNWSMNNNGNGMKIQGLQVQTYKMAARKYIYSVDQNPWYFRHKMKIASVGNIIKRSAVRLDLMSLFGMNTDFEIVRITNPKFRALVETLCT